MSGTVFESRRQRAADRIACAVSQFGLHDARGAGADEHTDAARTQARGRGLHGIEEAILPQRKLSQAIVAAVEYAQLRGQALCIDARHLADMRIDLDGFKVAAPQAAAVL